MMNTTQNPNWWAALAPQQSQVPPQSFPFPIPDTVTGPAAQPSYADLMAIGSPAAEPAGGYIPALPGASGAVQALRQALRLGGDAALSGEIMGASPSPATNLAGQLGRGRTLEGEYSVVQPASAGAARLPAPAGGARPAGGPPASTSAQNDWLSGLVRQASQANPGRSAAGGNAGGGTTAGGTTASAAPKPAPTGTAGAASSGGSGGIMNWLKNAFGKPGEISPMSHMRRPINNPLGYETADVNAPATLLLPDDDFAALFGGGAEGKFAFPEDIQTAREVLPQIDWDNMTEVDYANVAQVLSSLAPDEPTERSWLQDLSSWAAPALAMGTLLGPVGLLIGGLMGEGGRQTREQQRNEAYRTDLREWQAGLAEDLMKLQGLQRGQELETQQGIRNQAEGNFNFETGQEDRDAGRTQVRNQQMLDEVSAQRQMMEMDQMRRQQQLQAMMLNTGTGVDQGQILSQFIQSYPQVYAELQGNPLFQQWQMQANMKGGGNELAAQANLSMLMQELSQNPQYAPILQKLRQQMSLGAFISGR